MIGRHKVTVWMTSDLLAELRSNGKRTERSFSWLVQRCIRVALPEIQKLEAPPAKDARESEVAQ